MTTIAIAGGHGQIALHLTRLLTDRGDAVRSLVRNPDHRADIESAGATMALLDLEQATPTEMADLLAGCDAAVFAAGAGPGSGAARKETVDHQGAVKLRDACRLAGVERYVVISAMGTDDPPDGDDVFEVYLRAKAAADRAVMDSDLAWTIIRPGGLTDDPPIGRVALARHVDRGQVPRADVAATVAAVLAHPGATGHVLELVGGDTPIEQAVTALSPPA